MEKREDTPMEIYARGKRIMGLIEKNTAFIAMAKDEDKDFYQKKLERLKSAKESIKNEIYEEAKKKSGLDYSKKEKNPELLRKKYNEQLATLKKRKQELSLERRRLEKVKKEKILQSEQQYQFALEKYDKMLKDGKITKELYESRKKNMETAKLQDVLDWSTRIYNVQEEYNKADSEIDKVKDDLDELNKKEIIYNEYGDIYYRLFDEDLVERNKADSIQEKVESKEEKKEVKVTEEVVPGETTAANNRTVVPGPTVNPTVTPQANVNSNSNTGIYDSSTTVTEEKTSAENEEKKPHIVVVNKTMFDELYKKMKKGTISDNELNALVDTLANPDNYDKYGITTGIVFNKAKKILKMQGARTSKNIDNFLRENAMFSDSIKYSTTMEKDGVLSHDVLGTWKEIDKKLTYTDSRINVEEYIEQIEKYKDAGNELTKEQEAIFKKAMDIKKSLGSYRKAINVNDDITTSRNDRAKKSHSYNIFKSRHKDKSSRALPVASKEKSGYKVASGLDLSGLVNNEPAPEEVERGSEVKTKVVEKTKTK